ncbi:MAG: glycoside hydrolase family 1 protein [Chloroflexota bacterium]|nr:MAG: glycoside hydrolase family 1 protein [Chloroflexota bacterium]
MPRATFNFPRGFLWGTATSSHQVEGNNKNNNFWAWEHETDRIVNGHKSGLACDWWGGRWREDFERVIEGGHNAHRFSIEWSRVQPTPDRWDEEALDYYREMLQRLHEADITPMVTMHHFTDPLWISELGGWENEAIIGYFEAYVKKTVEALSEYTNLWITINEPNILVVYAYLFGLFPPGKKDIRKLGKVYSNLVRAHSAAYHMIHKIQPTARVGYAINYRSAKPAHAWNPLDRYMVRLISNGFNNAFPMAIQNGVLKFFLTWKRIPEAKGTQDFLGLNYYTREYVAFSLLHPGSLFMRQAFRPDAELSTTGFIANEPEGIYEAIKWGLQFKVPIIVTENGIEDEDDAVRPSYLIQHLHQIWRAINFNWPVKGYFHWTLIDNFEWERGWSQRFGLWELDIETQSRRKRPSADLFSSICTENCLSSEMVEQYAPHIFDDMFPGP